MASCFLQTEASSFAVPGSSHFRHRGTQLQTRAAAPPLLCVPPTGATSSPAPPAAQAPLWSCPLMICSATSGALSAVLGQSLNPGKGGEIHEQLKEKMLNAKNKEK